MILYFLSLFVRTVLRRRKDDVAGEVPVAFVVRTAGSTISEAEVKDYIAKQVKLISDDFVATKKKLKIKMLELMIILVLKLWIPTVY